jgi:hypothetical protein
MTENLTFGTAPVPALNAGRKIEPNPFDGKFPTKDGEALTVTLSGTAEANKGTVTNLTGKARRAADRLETPMTARVQVSEDGTGKNAKTILTIWTVDKIERKPADKADAPAQETATS